MAHIKAWREAGWSLKQIARELTRRQIPTKRDGAWYPATVKNLLENTLYREVA